MSSYLFISDPYLKTRQQLQDIDLVKNVSHLKEQIADFTGKPVTSQELIYNGELLDNDERSLSSYGVKNAVTVFVTEKVMEDMEQDVSDAEPVSLEEAQAIITKLKAPPYLRMLKATLKDNTKIDKLKKLNPILKNDHITTALFQDPVLLVNVISTGTAEGIWKAYPNIISVLKNVLDTVPKSCQLSSVTQDGSEDRSSASMEPEMLDAADLLTVQDQQQDQDQQGTSQQSTIRHQISASDLANALSFATTLTPDAGGSSEGRNESQLNEAVQQMRAIGIEDEDLCRRALNLSGGNVEAAINLIYEGTLT